MPEMDGLTLAKRIAEHNDLLPLVILSSMGQPIQAPPGLLAAHLTKPAKQVQLCEVLTKIIRERAADELPQPSARAGSLRGPSAHHAGLRILVAEDNPTNQRVALMMLKRLGYRANVVADGTEVIEMLRQAAYDVLLLDMRMPQMNGLDTMRQINAEWTPEERPHVVAMTADVTRETRAACMELGMAAFISKPIDERALAQTLSDYEEASIGARLTVRRN